MGRTIPPGGREKIEATGLSAAIEVTSNERGAKPLWLRGEPRRVYQAFEMSGDWDRERRYLSIKGPRDAGPQTKTIKIRRGTQAPIAPQVLAVEQKRHKNDWKVAVHVDTALREIRAGEEYELDITVSPPFPNGSYIGIVRLATGVSEQPTVELMIWPSFPWRLRPVVSGGPVPRVRTSSHELTYRFEWTPEAPPGRITAVRSYAPGLKSRIQQRGGDQVVVVRIPAKLPPTTEPMGYTLRVETDDPAVPELLLTIPFEQPTTQPKLPPPVQSAKVVQAPCK